MGRFELVGSGILEGWAGQIRWGVHRELDMIRIVDNVVVELPGRMVLVKVQPDAIRSRLALADSVFHTGHLM